MSQPIEIQTGAAELPIDIRVEHDEDGRRHLTGWVPCPTRGGVGVETCTTCPSSRGILLKPAGRQVALCARGTQAGEPRPEDCAAAWLSRPTLVVRSETPARELAAMIVAYDAVPFLVLDAHDVAIGIVTAADALAAALHGVLDTRSAEQIMRPVPVSMPEEASIVEAALRIATERAHVVPLSDPSGSVSSLLTAADALAWAAERARCG